MSLIERITKLESERDISRCMTQYMNLCDQLGPSFQIDRLLELFTEDAVWQGVGSRYSETFGKLEGVKSISEMFRKYCESPAHFALNVHLLSNEIIDVDSEFARGQWTLIQPSTVREGHSRLSCAQITAEFKKVNGAWKISMFQTESIFNREVQKPWDDHTSQLIPN